VSYMLFTISGFPPSKRAELMEYFLKSLSV
jgi:hypothetical protein